MNSTGAFPPNDGNGGDGTNNAKGGGGGKGGVLGATINDSTEPLPNFQKAAGEDGGLSQDAGGGGGGALAIINAQEYTVNGVIMGGVGGEGSDLQTNNMARGGGVALILNGSVFTVGAGSRVLGGQGGAKEWPNFNPLTDEYGGGGGLSIILNQGRLEIYAEVRGGASGNTLRGGDYTGQAVYEGSPGGGLYMKGGTTVNVYSTGFIATGMVTYAKHKAPPALILEGDGSIIDNQGSIFRAFDSSLQNTDAESVPAIYVLGNNNKVINSKLILGNYTTADSPGGSSAYAIEFEGNQNTLELWGGQNMRGVVNITNGTGNHLVLGGTNPGTFNFGTLDHIDPGDSRSQRTGYMGFADFTKNGVGTWTGGGVSQATGPWTIDEGTLALIDDGSLESHRSVTLNANLDISGVTSATAMKDFSGSSGSTINLGSKTLVLKNTQPQTFAGTASGTGGGIQIDMGTAIFTGDNTYTGLSTVAAGATLQLGAAGMTGSIAGDAAVDGHLIFNRSDNPTYAGAISGAGSVQKLGGGILELSGDSGAFAGSTSVDAGGLFVSGVLGGTLAVNTGTTLAGTGTIGGNTTIADGATLIGQQGHVLTFQNNLSLYSGSIVSVSLGRAPNAPGLFNVQGDLALNGTLNILDIGDFGPGLYRLFDFGGTRSGGLTLGTVPIGTDPTRLQFITDIPNQYDLYYTSEPGFNMWDGGDITRHDNGAVDGGDGVWDGSNNNWTTFDGAHNSIWSDDEVAQFGVRAGTVTVDDSTFPIRASGLVFSIDGYRLTGGHIVLFDPVDGVPTIRVGDGSSAGAAMTATIETELRGEQGFKKVDFGTLVLTGTNTYTGVTTVSHGTLQLGDGGNSGSILGDVVVDGDLYGRGTLAFNRSDEYAFSGAISGNGIVVQRGSGTTVFEGNNTFTGGLTVEKGTAKAGIQDHAFGSGLLTVEKDGTADLANLNETVGGLTGGGYVALGSGTLTLEQNINTTFSGMMDGAGGLNKNGNGTLTLSGTGSYAGETNVNGGALVQGAAGAFSSASTYLVANNALIDLGGHDTDMAGLSNSGTVNFGGSGGTTLNVAGNYVGNGGMFVINSVLNGDDSKTDMLKVGGDTSGNTNLKVVNRGGLGAQTVNGIEVVDVGGQSNGTFSLLGDFVTKDGKQAVRGGAYAYTLQQGPGTGGNDGNWYLTSQFVDQDCHLTNTCPQPVPPAPRYSPSVPVYEGYLQNMQALNKLPTLQERVGERYWTGRNGDGQATGAAVDDKGVWARVEGAHNRLEPDTSLSRMKQDINTFIMQAGVDGQFYESDNGKLIAGITGQYGHAKGDISSFHGDGAISTDGWSLGATATWYGTSGFYVDGQAQVTWFDSDLNSWTANQGLADGRKATGYALSIEAGQRFAIDQNWSLTPQAQLMYSSINADSFRDAWDSRVSLHDGDSLIGRLGLAANYANSWQGKDGLTVNTTVYGIANLYQEMLSGSSVNVAGVAFDTDNDRTWGGIGAGGTYAWADNKYAVYGEGTINTALNHFADSYTLKGTVGFKVKW